MADADWVREFPGAITAVDQEGRIVEMNDRAAAGFAADGGRALVGCSVFDCHPDAARRQIAAMIESGRSNVYTIEKRGVRKLIYQAPWYRDGKFAGLVELSLEIPDAIPHFVRDKAE